MPSFIPLQAAYHELDALYELDEDGAALIDVLFEALSDDAQMLARLCQPDDHYTYTPPFEIKRFAAMQRLGKNIYTLKVRDVQGGLLPYRVLMGYHAQIDTYFVLAVLPREIAYDKTDPNFRRVMERYEQAGIPTYPH